MLILLVFRGYFAIVYSLDDVDVGESFFMHII
jgi:hypothetical protein